MNDKFFTTSKILSTVKTDGFKYVSLEREDGVKIYPFNTRTPGEVDKHIKKICNALNNSGTLADGIYIVACAHSLARGTQLTLLRYKKGNPTVNSSDTPAATRQQAPTVYQATVVPKEITSYADLLKLHQELAELKASNAALQKDNAELTAYVAELEAECEDAVNSGVGSAGPLSAEQEFQKTMMTTVAKVVDKLSDRMLGEDKPKEIEPKKEKVLLTKEMIFFAVWKNNLYDELVEFLQNKEQQQHETTNSNGQGNQTND